MSAWAELVSSNGSDEWLELCNRALLEVQRETSRRNAARQRAWAESFGETPTQQAIRSVVNETADLIDPEVK